MAFLDAAVRAGVAFKATAGLHHAVRGRYRLTYAADAASAPMYGYLNVLLATAALRAGQAAPRPRTCSPAPMPRRWRSRTPACAGTTSSSPPRLLRATRASHLVGFGSCSFGEPADEIRPLLAARS